MGKVASTATCFICRFDFAKAYGEKLAGVIHVHHLFPLATRAQDHLVDPVRDLRPLCPNCHYFVHSEDPPINVDEARGSFAERRRP